MIDAHNKSALKLLCNVWFSVSFNRTQDLWKMRKRLVFRSANLTSWSPNHDRFVWVSIYYFTKGDHNKLCIRMIKWPHCTKHQSAVLGQNLLTIINFCLMYGKFALFLSCLLTIEAYRLIHHFHKYSLKVHIHKYS